MKILRKIEFGMHLHSFTRRARSSAVHIGTLLLLMSMQPAGGEENSSLDLGHISCLMEPSDEISLSSQVSGVASKMHVRRGDLVKKGQLLVSLESESERIQLELARARYQFSKRKIERNDDLMKKGLLSGHETDELMTEKNIASLEVKKAREELKRRSIYSPVSGLVVDQDISPGEYVGSKPLMTLAVLNPVHAEVVMSANDYGRIKKGDRVTVITNGYKHGKYEGTVNIVDQVIHAASGTFGVQISLPNDDFSLPVGVKCNVQVE